MTDNGDTPGATQDSLPLAPAHVVHICVMLGEAKDPKRVDKKEIVIITKKV